MKVHKRIIGDAFKQYQIVIDVETEDDQEALRSMADGFGYGNTNNEEKLYNLLADIKEYVNR